MELIVELKNYLSRFRLWSLVIDTCDIYCFVCITYLQNVDKYEYAKCNEFLYVLAIYIA